MANVGVVIPTYNEAENIGNLIGMLEALKRDIQIIIVDDNSSDGTGDIVKSLKRNYGNIILHSRPGKLGIGSAVRDGMQVALSFPDCQYIVTMDADFSHDPKDVSRLLHVAERQGMDLVQGSRYVEGGKIIGWNFFRRLQSRIANILCSLLFGLPHEVTTYFRVYSRKCAEIVVNSAAAGNYEFAVTTALVIKDHGLKTIEVPIVFVNRTQGKSKLKASNILAWFYLICKLFLSRQLCSSNLKRFLKFGTVGALGILVNMGLLWMLSELLGLFYIFSSAVSIETSVLFNFTLNNTWTFRGRRHLAGNVLAKALRYNITCALGLAVNLGVLTLLTEVFGVYYLISNLFGIAAASIWNYTGSTRWAWRVRGASKIESIRGRE